MTISDSCKCYLVCICGSKLSIFQSFSMDRYILKFFALSPVEQTLLHCHFIHELTKVQKKQQTQENHSIVTWRDFLIVMTMHFIYTLFPSSTSTLSDISTAQIPAHHQSYLFIRQYWQREAAILRQQLQQLRENHRYVFSSRAFSLHFLIAMLPWSARR